MPEVPSGGAQETQDLLRYLVASKMTRLPWPRRLQRSGAALVRWVAGPRNVPAESDTTFDERISQ